MDRKFGKGTMIKPPRGFTPFRELLYFSTAFFLNHLKIRKGTQSGEDQKKTLPTNIATTFPDGAIIFHLSLTGSLECEIERPHASLRGC